MKPKRPSELSSEERRWVLAVRCPTCKAVPTVRCVETTSGREMPNSIHADRFAKVAWEANQRNGRDTRNELASPQN